MLPVAAALPELIRALARHGRAVLQAPPGAGKTTHVPLALISEDGLVPGRIVMLEPRRLAARAAAERMARTLGEEVGQTVGYRMRGDSRTSPATRIEVVTEGVLTRQIQRDPELTDVSMIIFDEFHERSLNADLGLALAWDIRQGLRDDLQLLVMSATLDAEPVARMLDDAPVITSRGQSFAVETRWLDRPPDREQRFEDAVSDLTLQALGECDGSALVFLPGAGEIHRVKARLGPRLPADTRLMTLYGGLDFSAQRAAIEPVDRGRKVVLATAIAETSITIDGVRIVVDGGRARRARYDPGSGMSRLVTETVSRAEADQRRGRAGRTEPGVCYRLWTRGQEGGHPPFPPAEIEAADLAALALELANWGAADDNLSFLTPPPPGALAGARELLTRLDALDAHGRITAHGRRISRHPLHPRLAHMLERVGNGAAPLAALLSERDILTGAPVDMSLRLEALRDPAGFATRRPHGLNQPLCKTIRAEVRRLSPGTDAGSDMTPGEMAALAFPDRIGLRRSGDAPRWVLSGGRGAQMNPDDPMADERLIVALDTDGQAREARIRLALPLTETALRRQYGDQIIWQDDCHWSRRTRTVSARQVERFGALTLSERPWRDAPPEAIAAAAAEGIRDLGLACLAPSAVAREFCRRVEFARRFAPDLPGFDNDSLLSEIDEWLGPHLSACRNEKDFQNLDILGLLRARLDWEQLTEVDRLAPASYLTPLDRRIPLQYQGDAPEIEVRLQEMFGLTTHPMIGAGRIPLRVTLLSPAGRPVQTTTDLPNFWRESYLDVRKDMRGRYPKHHWPDDPSTAAPTLRAKPRSR